MYINMKSISFQFLPEIWFSRDYFSEKIFAQSVGYLVLGRGGVLRIKKNYDYGTGGSNNINNVSSMHIPTVLCYKNCYISILFYFSGCDVPFPADRTKYWKTCNNKNGCDYYYNNSSVRTEVLIIKVRWSDRKNKSVHVLVLIAR